MQNDEIDLDKARLNPGSVFASPKELHDHSGLSRQLKIEILRRWAYDASELEVAEEEGMAGGESWAIGSQHPWCAGFAYWQL